MNEGDILNDLGVENVAWNRQRLRNALDNNEPTSFCVREQLDRETMVDTYTYVTVSPTGAPKGHKVVGEVTHPQAGRILLSQRQIPRL